MTAEEQAKAEAKLLAAKLTKKGRAAAYQAAAKALGIENVPPNLVDAVMSGDANKMKTAALDYARDYLKTEGDKYVEQARQEALKAANDYVLAASGGVVDAQAAYETYLTVKDAYEGKITARSVATDAAVAYCAAEGLPPDACSAAVNLALDFIEGKVTQDELAESGGAIVGAVAAAAACTAVGAGVAAPLCAWAGSYLGKYAGRYGKEIHDWIHNNIIMNTPVVGTVVGAVEGVGDEVLGALGQGLSDIF